MKVTFTNENNSVKKGTWGKNVEIIWNFMHRPEKVMEIEFTTKKDGANPHDYASPVVARNTWKESIRISGYKDKITLKLNSSGVKNKLYLIKKGESSHE